MRIATLYVDGTANAHYRVVVPLRELERRGHTVLWPQLHPPERVFAGSPQFDVMLLHHLHGDDDLALMRRLREHGVATIWDTDDDIFAGMLEESFGRIRRRKERRAGEARTLEMARIATMLTTPSAVLAERYRERGVERTAVIENFVAPSHAGAARPRHQGVVIGLTAGREHSSDLRKLRVAHLLTRLLDAQPSARVMTIGNTLELPSPRYANVRRVPIERLIATEREFDIGIAPLVDSPFNQARSNVKLKEYAAAGAMWLASPVGPYAGMDEGKGGLLVDDDAWLDQLNAHVEDYRRRVALMEEARVWARDDSATAAASRWEAAFREAILHARGQRNPAPSSRPAPRRSSSAAAPSRPGRAGS